MGLFGGMLRGMIVQPTTLHAALSGVCVFAQGRHANGLDFLCARLLARAPTPPLAYARAFVTSSLARETGKSSGNRWLFFLCQRKNAPLSLYLYLRGRLFYFIWARTRRPLHAPPANALRRLMISLTCPTINIPALIVALRESQAAAATRDSFRVFAFTLIDENVCLCYFRIWIMRLGVNFVMDAAVI